MSRIIEAEREAQNLERLRSLVGVLATLSDMDTLARILADEADAVLVEGLGVVARPVGGDGTRLIRAGGLLMGRGRIRSYNGPSLVSVSEPK